MASKTIVTQRPTRESQFKIKPLVASIHVLISGGLIASSITPVQAELPQPMPSGWVSPGGSATSQIDGNTLNIKQITDKVILNWQSFNVGKENIVHFTQPTNSSVALNRINDQSPSKILGEINANGQVYLLNRNGFVFGKDSIINTNSLVVSTLNISQQVFERGITQVYTHATKDAAFGDQSVDKDQDPGLNRDISVNKASSITFEKGLKTDADNRLVDGNNKLILDKSNKPIVVDQGFNTNAKGQLVNSAGQLVVDRSGKAIKPVSVEAKVHADKDGRIIIVAPNIVNNGNISAENHGQILMAASQDKVYLQAADEKSPFAGLVVEVDTGGKVTNAGEILTKEGNITMAGFAVNQEGRVSATTSVNVNGSIRLVAREGHEQSDALLANATTRTEDIGDGLGKTSKLTFAKNSVTEIVPDADKTTAITEQSQPQSSLEGVAHTVELKSNSSIKVTGGNVNITATDKPLLVSQGTGGRIFVDKSAKIDVSGVKNVKVAMERNVADISVQSFELRNSPLQLTGVLKGADVKVDLRDQNSIIDTTGAQARVKRDINERLTAGGKINLTSSGDVIVNSGAKLDVSGGSVAYQDGYIKTTKLIEDNGRILDINAANPNEHYTGIYGLVKEHNQKFGTTQQWDVSGKGQFEKGYIDGKSAGTISVSTPKLAWAGDVTAKFVTGVNQRVPLSPTTPTGGTFTIDMAVFQSPQNVRFQSQKKQLDFTNDPVNGENPEFPKDASGIADALVLDTSLTNSSGITKLSVKTWGDATLDNTAAIKMLPGSSFAVEAGNIADSGSIKTAGGNVVLNAVANILYPQAGKVSLDKAASVNVSGLWVNDLQKGLASAASDQLWIDGGNVKITGQNDVLIPVGSTISADGGAWLSAARNLTAGKGGSITLGALGNSGVPSTLTLSGSVSAFSLSKGGSLSLTSGNVVVDKQENLDKDSNGNAILKGTGNSNNTLALGTQNGGFVFAPKFGFSKLSLEGNFAGVTVKEDVLLDLKTKNLFLDGDYQNRATGSSIRDFTHLVLLPEAQRQAQQITLTGTTGYSNVSLEKGSQLNLEKNSTVSISSTGSILVDGTIKAPAGKISLQINPLVALIDYNPSQEIWLGAHANLLVAGASLMNPIGILGQQTGNVLDGGDVSISAKRGYVILEQGSQIDVSGTQAKVDIYQKTANGQDGFKTSLLGSSAGSIAITAAEGIVVDGNLKGQAGSANQAAGTLQVSLDRNSRSEPDNEAPIKVPFPDGLLNIQLEQHDRRILSADARFGDNVATDLNGQLVISADEIATGGFSNFQLSLPKQGSVGQVSFAGDVTLATAESIKLDSPNFVWAGKEGVAGTVNLNSAYIQLGSTSNRDILDSPASGNGVFNANAQWLSLVGASLWNGFANVNLTSKHDLRTTGIRITERDFVGALITAANLNLNASQIYPSTLSSFTFNTAGNINITGSDTDVSPLSAGGSLTFIAANIQQDGVVKAPLGSLNFSASKSLTLGSGSVTSVSGKGQVTPFGVTKGGLDWAYPLITSSQDLVDQSRQASVPNLLMDAPPIKQLVLNAPEVTLATGSKLDIAGGGDVMATEFKPVSEEMTDFLQLGSAAYIANNGSFAVLPTLTSALAPYDPMLSVGWNLAAGQQVYLNGTSQLQAGKYTILPAYYALLPGAFLITPQANSQDSNITTASIDGTPIVSGYQIMAGTGTRDARTSGYMVQSMSEMLQQHAQYSVTCAGTCSDTFKEQADAASAVEATSIKNSLAFLTGKQKILTENFFQAKATAKEVEVPTLPADSGQISIIAQTKLLLDGDINFAGYGAKAKGARMDIAANNIHIVKQKNAIPVEGELDILDTDLSKLSVDSLLLGGARTFKTDGSTDVAVTANTVTFDQGAQVTMKDLTAAATDRVEVKTDAGLTATGTVNTGDTTFNVTGDGALLRVSADKQITLNRTGVTGAQGDLIVASGATIKSTQSMVLDASKTNTLAGDVFLQKGSAAAPSSLLISANSVNIGKVDGLADDALNLSNAKLMNLAVDELVLNSHGTMSFYGNVGQVDANGNVINGSDGSPVPIVFDKLVLNTAALAGFGAEGQSVRLQANTLVLANPFTDAAVNAGNGLGSLNLSAKQVTFGGGQIASSGFNTVNLTAENNLLVDKSTQLQIPADVNLKAGYMTATGGTDFKLDATGHNLSVTGIEGAKLPTVTTDFGAAMNFTADTINFDSNVQLASGKLALHALSKDISVGSSAKIDLAGRKVNFADSADFTPGGIFTATADNGSVALADGSSLDMRSGGGTATAGNLLVKAPGGSVDLSGQIQATNGSAAIDFATFSANKNFDSLLVALQAAGINNSVNVRSRIADITQSAGVTFSANTLTLVADQGGVDIYGQLHTNGTDQGGNLGINAGDKITLESGSQLTATGTHGGKITLSSTDNDLDSNSGIELKAGSLIDVSGATADQNGLVTLRALRTDTGISIQPIAGNVIGAKTLLAEGVKKYVNADLAAFNADQTDDGEINSEDISGIKSDTDTYMNADMMQNVASSLGHGAVLIPGVEIDYTGDLALKSRWDLIDWRYNGNPGHLVIRASGELNLMQTLTDGFKTETFNYLDADVAKSVTVNDKLQTGNSWSYGLTGGADLPSAAPNTTSSSGGLVIGSNVMVRTGTGDIQLNAGGDITFTKAAAQVSKTGVSAPINSNVLVVSKTAGWEVGAYVSGTGIAPGTTIVAVNNVPVVSKKPALAVTKDATILPVANTTGWLVNTYVAGTGLAAGTKITAIDPAITNQVSASVARGGKILTVVANSGWKVGTVLTGTGIASGTKVTSIDDTGTKITISAGTSAAIAKNAKVTSLQDVVLSNPTTAALSVSTSISTQSTVELSAATTAKLASTSVIKLNSINGTVYNAGQASTVDPYGTLTDASVAKFFYSEYPVNGGDLTLVAGGNINGAVSGNDYNDWLLRIGDLTNSSLDLRKPVAWGIGLGVVSNLTSYNKTSTPYFQQNIGSFGGGNVSVSAGGNITDLEVAIPTTGKQIAENINNSIGGISGFTDSNGVTRSQVEINGGGNLLLSAGGNVEGGSFYVAKGVASITSQGQVTGDADAKKPIFYTGDTQLSINAGTGVSIAGVFDPMISHKGDVDFFSYTDANNVTIRAVSGDLQLDAENYSLPGLVNPTSAQKGLAAIYPASLQASAFGGSVYLNNEIILYPSSKSKLNVFAQKEVTSKDLTGQNAVFDLAMSDADTSLFPTVNNPGSIRLEDAGKRISPYGPIDIVHAPTPLHTGDTDPVRIVTLKGDIWNINLNLAKNAILESGRDISNLMLDVQNVNKDDVTIIEAARDIVFPSERDTNTGALIASDTRKLEVAGYGDMLVKAGRNIDLGSSTGMSTVGNTYNPNLLDKGANITVLAGLNGGTPDYAGFINKYESTYGKAIQSTKQAITLFMQEYTGNSALSSDDAYSQFVKLPADQTLPVQSKLNTLLLPVLFGEIKAAGTASASDKTKGNQGGYDAINALFPGNTWQGDLSLYFSKLQTQLGGDINLLVPGGSINAGLAVSFTGSKPSSELGIVALQQGNINAVLRDNFLVNKSRVFALDGGDIMIWSSEGDIDAGKGAKSAISAPPAKATIDPITGKIKYILPPVVQGSGIRTAGTEGTDPGNVYLFAPKGVVDAGEAGIGGNNVIISAVAVLGAGNIQIGGIGVGVPVASTGGLSAGLSGTSNIAAGVGKSVESAMSTNSTNTNTKDIAEAVKKMVLGMLSVEFLGFGDE